ncbi:CRISPR-associated ring nuclease Crn3/Csx3 [Adonisia turfae]|uniref:CRISPR-associated protein Csx3 n=1 Tax=Adonisia turfae CCMR0081 TaxID=2292702 RepID=A0A6M0RQQ4_9CYAN|nr:CRISPR-associated protein Csx3 [Adonisia turfae CCMR0081]
MADASIQLTLSHHQTTQGLAYQLVTIELVSRDRIIEPQELATLRLPAGLDPRKGVVLSGRAPVWLYAYLVHECHPTVWVACFDPRLGAVVTTTHSKLVSVGQVLPLEDLNLGVPSIQPDKLGPALLVVGPPDSGKSVLSHQLFVTLVKDYPDVYLQRAQWDGEGNWTLELPENASEREAFKLANKGTLTERFFPYQGQAIRNLRQQKSLVIVDAGGMVQPEKQSILDACTHYLIISSKPEEIEPWHKFCGNQGNLQPIAVIHSTLETMIEVLQREPFLEVRCGPWVQGETDGVPEVLVEQVRALLQESL